MPARTTVLLDWWTKIIYSSGKAFYILSIAVGKTATEGDLVKSVKI